MNKLLTEALADWMSTPVVTADPETLVGDALEKLGTKRHLPVCSDGTFHGFLHAATLRQTDPAMRLAQLTLQQPTSAPLNTHLASALSRLRATANDALWITEDGALVGVLTEHDVCRLAAHQLMGTRLTVTDVATAAPSTVHVDANASAALSKMVQLWVRHLPVLGQDGLVGILSWRDVVDIPPNSPIQPLINPAITTVNWNTPLQVAAERLVERQVGSAAVIGENHELEGILTRSDLLRSLIEPVGLY